MIGRLGVGLVAGLLLLVAGCDTGPRSRDTFEEIRDLTGVVAVDAAGNHSLALTGDGRVLAWGDAEGGRGGPAPEEDCSGRSPSGYAPCRTTPAAVPLPGPATAIASADDHQAALVADGAVWRWGSDHDPPGVRAVGSCEAASGVRIPCRRTPSRVEGLPPAVALATGLAHTVAVDREGRVWQWGEVPAPLATATCSGEPSYGRDYPCRPDPVRIDGLPPVVAVSAHESVTTLAIDVDGGVWGWSGGRSSDAPGATATPTRVPVPVPVAGVASNRSGTVLVGRDGSVWVTGRLPGLAADTCGAGCALSPVQEMPAGSAEAPAGIGGLRVRTPDGRVLIRDREGWTPSPEPSPSAWVPDPDLAGAAMVANGDQHILVLRPDGRVLAQGYNAEGQLGL